MLENKHIKGHCRGQIKNYNSPYIQNNATQNSQGKRPGPLQSTRVHEIRAGQTQTSVHLPKQITFTSMSPTLNVWRKIAT